MKLRGIIILPLLILSSCRSTQMPDNWVQSDDEQPVSSSPELQRRFEQDSRACTSQANALEGKPGGIPQDQEPDVYLHWDGAYADCMRNAGWKLR